MHVVQARSLESDPNRIRVRWATRTLSMVYNDTPSSATPALRQSNALLCVGELIHQCHPLFRFACMWALHLLTSEPNDFDASDDTHMCDMSFVDGYFRKMLTGKTASPTWRARMNRATNRALLQKHVTPEQGWSRQLPHVTRERAASYLHTGCLNTLDKMM